MIRAVRFVRRILRMMEMPSAQWRTIKRGYNSSFDLQSVTDEVPQHSPPNALREFFDSRKEGPGIWKWNHYFDIYDRHFRRFRGREVHVLEIGVYSGGSLEMWRKYFGPEARIYGVDIEPDCRVYESDNVKIFIGDQADRQFWREFCQKVSTLDIVIDDGGHKTEQRIVSVEELLPFLRPGGVYLCEDVYGAFNPFASYIHGLGHKLNEWVPEGAFPDDNERRIVCGCTPFQGAVGSIHLYPFITVLERNASKVSELRAPKHGSQWQPWSV